MEDAVARIAWLEDIIKAQLPHTNLHNGPHPNRGHVVGTGTSYCGNGELTLHSSTPDLQYSSMTSQMELPQVQSIGPLPPFPNHGFKRPLSSIPAQSNQVSSVEEDTRSVALGLGFLSLNSDSRQSHYLGSSSGSLLASLVRTETAHKSDFDGSRGSTTSLEIDDTLGAKSQSSTELNRVHFDILRTSINGLYAQLRKVSQFPL